MPQSVPASNSGNITVTVIPQANGRSICEVTTLMDGQTGSTKRFHGQNAKHAMAIALEDLASTLRMEAEAEQNIGWDVVEQSSSGKVNEKRFHVILHYERVTEEKSKFEAMHNTLMGNTVVENADISVIQVDSDLPVEPLDRRHK